MKNKRSIIIVSIATVIIILGIIIFMFINKDSVSENNVDEIVQAEEVESGTIEFLNAIAGIKAENIEIINDPVVGIKGKFIAPEKSIVNGIDYFLEYTENSKMNNLQVDINNNSIDIYVNYAVTSNTDIPIKVKINPSLNENKDLVINIEEVKVLDLKVANFLVDLALKTFAKDWFNESNMKVEYENTKVIINKENFDAVSIESIVVNDDDINLEIIINAAKLSGN